MANLLKTDEDIVTTGTISGSNLSGTNTGDQTIVLTGDITGSGTGSFATTLATVTVPKGGTGKTSNTAYAVLCGGTTTTAALQSVAALGSSGNVLTSNGAGALPTFQAPAGGGITALTGDVTASGSGSVVATIANNAVTLAKMATQAANTILANNTAGAAIPAAVAISASRIVGRGSSGNIAGLTAGTGITIGASSISTTAFTQILKKYYNINGSYTPTAGMKYVTFESIGGGAGGGGAAGGVTTAAAGGGGGGGGYGITTESASLVNALLPITLTIGAGGAGGAAGANDGSDGGDTLVVGTGATQICVGGGGYAGTGGAGLTITGATAGGVGGLASDVADMEASGGAGSPGIVLANTGIGGAGGSSYLSGPGPSSINTVGSVDVSAFGVGGGGAGATSTSHAGANGLQGIIIITEYI